MRLQKLAVKKEPKKRDKYLVEIKRGEFIRYGHVNSLKDVRKLIDQGSYTGNTIQVFKVETNFIQSYKRTK